MIQKILLANRDALGDEYTGDKSAPAMIVRFVPEIGGPHGMFDLVDDAPAHQSVWAPLEQAVLDIAPQADFYCICCNTLHFLEPKLRALPTEAECPLISIVDATGRYCEANGIPSAAVLGSELISNVEKKEGGSPYARLSCGLDVISTAQKKAVQEGLIDIKRYGPKDERVVCRFKQLAAELDSSALVLACTELPLLDWDTFYAEKSKMPKLIDPTDVLAKELVDRSLKGPSKLGSPPSKRPKME